MQIRVHKQEIFGRRQATQVRETSEGSKPGDQMKYGSRDKVLTGHRNKQESSIRNRADQEVRNTGTMGARTQI